MLLDAFFIKSLVELEVVSSGNSLLDGLLLDLDRELEGRVLLLFGHLQLRPGFFAAKGLVSGVDAGSIR
jgi:hypothetical protein